ncbi:LytR family transcriptional attenuator [Mobilisporobacter senegalensis]|uniref:LytR family transcriptional attenuator n=1 Tax=Mobilisporobacter senegalensis TaxID=1329262 RepID=A0A3N1XTW2_9FIRM|nr:LCP family protein [Mobilisporobacter senegalensis]ROR28612.1 LytR family transcriptional attenuator [Mobilisporobacter senegalensis]
MSKKRKKSKAKIIFILEILLILLLIPVVYIYLQIEKVPSADIDLNNISQNEINNPDMKNYRNIAFFGVDSRANDLKKNTRSDSIMIMSINKKTKKVKLASIYRDTYVNVEGHGYTKLNHAYSYGGPELALSTINTNFDLNCTEFVTVNFSALTNVIDLLGGITLNIEENELKHVNNYARDVAKINGTKYNKITSPGEQVVDGTQATGYSRVRYTAGGDFRRAERQRTVVEQVFKKAKKSNITTLVSIMNEMIPQIYTSLDTKEMLNYGKDIFFYELNDQTGFPIENQAGKIGGTSYVLPTTLESNVTALHKFLFGTENYEPSNTVKARSQEIDSKF